MSDYQVKVMDGNDIMLNLKIEDMQDVISIMSSVLEAAKKAASKPSASSGFGAPKTISTEPIKP